MATDTASPPDIPIEELDHAYATIMSAIVETTQAPHYAELAPVLGIDVERSKQIMHQLCAVTPGWMHPNTDWLSSFPPFNVQPTQYRIQIGERHGWFGQGGFESLAVRWLVPGQTVRVEAPCLSSGEPMVIEMRDEEILLVEPNTVVGYTSQMVGGDAASRPFRGASMNLFRSGDDARNWSGFDADMAGFLKPVAAWAEIFSNPFFRERGRADYLSWTQTEAGQAAFGDLRAALAP